jgi:hypothetical protein
MSRRAIGYTTAGLLALLTLAACSSGGSDAGSHSAIANAAGGMVQPAPNEKAPGAAREPAVAPSPGGADATTTGLVTEAKIRTAQMTVDVRGSANVAKQADAAASIATGAGGEVDADERTSGAAATATMQLRVPPARLGGVLGELSKLGKERRRELSVTDVSEKVADVDSRVISAQDAIVRLRALYASASKVGEVIVVEGELSRREADLESLQAQQRTLARQTAMAVVSLTLQTAATVHPAAKPHKHASGFVAGLRRGWDGFVDAAGWIATAAGTVLPFLVLVVLLALGGRLAWRRMPHGPGPAPAPSPAD